MGGIKRGQRLASKRKKREKRGTGRRMAQGTERCDNSCGAANVTFIPCCLLHAVDSDRSIWRVNIFKRFLVPYRAFVYPPYTAWRE